MLAQRCVASETEELEQSWSEGTFLEDLGMEVQHLAMELAAGPIIRQLFHFCVMATDISRMTHLSHLYFYTDNTGLLILTLAEGFLTLGLKAGHIPQVQHKSHLTKLSDVRQSTAAFSCAHHPQALPCCLLSTVDRTLASPRAFTVGMNSKATSMA